MSQEKELQQLEECIGRLLHDFDALKKEKALLEDTLLTREATIAELRDQLEENGIEKLEIEDRIGRILQKIVTWEQENNTEAQGEGSGTSASEAVGTVSVEESAAEPAESSSGHQASLFKVADE